jgi:hypothetical protein
VIANAVAMKMSISEVLAMPLYDYQAAIHAHNLAQGDGEDAKPLTEQDFDDMLFGMAVEGMH